MLLTFNDQYAMAQDLSSDDSAGTLTTFKDQINVGTGILRHQLSQYIFEEDRTLTSVASTQSYELPVRTVKVNTVTYTSGSIPYVLTAVSDRFEWNRINESTTTTSSYPEYYFVDKDKIHFYPTPNTSSDTITLRVEERFSEMTLADYTTGTITTLANGDGTVTGSGTAFSTTTNVNPKNAWFKVNTDGDWYEVSSITSATVLELVKNYEGTSLAAASDAYTIGEQALGAYEDLHILPVYYALAEFYSIRRSRSQEIKYRQLWQNGLDKAIETYSSASTSGIISSRRVTHYPYGRANQFPTNVTA